MVKKYEVIRPGFIIAEEDRRAQKGEVLKWDEDTKRTKILLRVGSIKEVGKVEKPKEPSVRGRPKKHA